MFSFTGWILFGACSSVGTTQGSAMIINFFFGTVVNAAFAIANQVEAFILMFARMLNQAAVPQNNVLNNAQSNVEAQVQSSGRRYCVFRFEGPMEELQAFNPILNAFIKEHDVKVTILEKGEC